MYVYAHTERGPGPRSGFGAKDVRNGRKDIMKQDRHTAIRELVAGAPIGSQDELRRRLAKRGFEVTQATLSRDIHELHLYKGPNGYAAPNGLTLEEDDDLPQTPELLNSFGLRVKQAMNQLVLITTSGSAQPVALAIDVEEWPVGEVY